MITYGSNDNNNKVINNNNAPIKTISNIVEGVSSSGEAPSKYLRPINNVLNVSDVKWRPPIHDMRTYTLLWNGSSIDGMQMSNVGRHFNEDNLVGRLKLIITFIYFLN